MASSVDKTAFGAIMRMATLPCSNPPEVWAETAGDAALRAIWTIATPVWKDYVKWGTGRSWLCNLKQVASETEDAEPTFASGARRFVFAVDAWIDKTVWWLFLASVTEGALLDWSTAMFKMQSCQPGKYPNYKSSGHSLGGWPDTTAWQAGPSWGPFIGEVVVGPSMRLRPGEHGFIGGSADIFTTTGVLPVITNFRLRVRETGAILDYFDGTTVSADNLGKGHVWGSYKNNTAADVHVDYEVQFPFGVGAISAIAGGGGSGVMWHSGPP